MAWCKPQNSYSEEYVEEMLDKNDRVVGKDVPEMYVWGIYNEK